MQEDFQRYSCQIALPGFSESTQQKLKDAKVLIVGAGGLGCPVAQYLASSGVGTIGIVDSDTISLSNLHRQILYTPAEIGEHKASTACKKLQQQNPDIKLIPYNTRITHWNVIKMIGDYDIVVDATDNFETKYLLNDACFLTEKPLVHGAIYQFEGQLAIWNIKNEDGTRSPNYRDLYPEANAAQVPNCADGGVIPTLAGIIGCMQANEVIKYLSGVGELLIAKLLIFDALTLQSRIIKLQLSTKTNITRLVPTIQPTTISALELKRDFNNNKYDLIDVRTAGEHNQFNIGGRHIPIQVLEDHIASINKNKTTILYCSSGVRSLEAVKIIKKYLPMANILSLDGGISAWQRL